LTRGEYDIATIFYFEVSVNVVSRPDQTAQQIHPGDFEETKSADERRDTVRLQSPAKKAILAEHCCRAALQRRSSRLLLETAL